MNHDFFKDCQEFKSQWYRCRGTCLNYTFHGIVRSSFGAPGIANQFFSHHEEKCGGTFFKIYEVHRPSADLGIEYKYLNHIRYMTPKAEISKHFKTNIQPRSMVDLTDEASGSGNTVSLTEVIDLDDSVEEDALGITKIADEFISNFNMKFKAGASRKEIKCPLCESQIQQKLFALHLDGCMGISQNIEFRLQTQKPSKRGISPCSSGFKRLKKEK